MKDREGDREKFGRVLGISSEYRGARKGEQCFNNKIAVTNNASLFT